MKKILNRGKQKGGALLVAMIFLGVLTMVGISVTFTSSSQMMVSYNHEDMSDSFWAAHEALLIALDRTVAGNSLVATDDMFLNPAIQSSPLTEIKLSQFAASDDVLKVINTSLQGAAPILGNAEGGSGKKITISIKQKAKGAICPRAQNGSSVTKIACDHFDIYSRVEPDDSGTGPGVQMGVYREMIHSNSTTHKDMDLSAGS